MIFSAYSAISAVDGFFVKVTRLFATSSSAFSFVAQGRHWIDA